MNAYAIPEADAAVPEPLTSADIDTLFKRSPGWFARDRVRKRLYAKGFPHPCDRGRWSKIAVGEWMAGVGANPDNVPPNVKPRRRQPRTAASGYAPA